VHRQPGSTNITRSARLPADIGEHAGKWQPKNTVDWCQDERNGAEGKDDVDRRMLRWVMQCIVAPCDALYFVGNLMDELRLELELVCRLVECGKR
jgi:hypothetical protein